MRDEHSKIKQWYMSKFPSDELGEEINEEVTFHDVFVALKKEKDVYEVISPSCDSVIRERIFEELAYIMELSYEDIYDLWIRG